MMFPHPTAPSRQDPLPETSIQFYSSFCFVRTRTPWIIKLSTDLWQNVEHVANIANFRSATEIYYLNLQLHSPPSLQVTPEDTQTDSNGPQSPSRQSQVPASLTDRKVLKSGRNGGFSD